MWIVSSFQKKVNLVDRTWRETRRLLLVQRKPVEKKRIVCVMNSGAPGGPPASWNFELACYICRLFFPLSLYSAKARRLPCSVGCWERWGIQSWLSSFLLRVCLRADLSAFPDFIPTVTLHCHCLCKSLSVKALVCNPPRWRPQPTVALANQLFIII